MYIPRQTSTADKLPALPLLHSAKIPNWVLKCLLANADFNHSIMSLKNMFSESASRARSKNRQRQSQVKIENTVKSVGWKEHHDGFLRCNTIAAFVWDTKSQSAGLSLLQLELIERSHYFALAQKTCQDRTDGPMTLSDPRDRSRVTAKVEAWRG